MFKFFKKMSVCCSALVAMLFALVSPAFCEPPPTWGEQVGAISFDVAPVQTLGLSILGALALIWVVKRIVSFLGGR